jgi:hypothetical protein
MCKHVKFSFDEAIKEAWKDAQEGGPDRWKPPPKEDRKGKPLSQEQEAILQKMR